MSDELKKINRLRDSIIGIEMQLSSIQKELLVTKADLKFFYKMESTLEFNIRTLKKEKVIAMAYQYKKSVDELKRVRSNIKLYSESVRNLEKREVMYIKTYADVKEEYKKAKKALESRKVVLFFDPKKRKKGTNSEG